MDGFKLLETIGLELDLPVISEYAAHTGVHKKREPQLSSLVADLAMDSMPTTRKTMFLSSNSLQ
jgi:hypothetical protein